MESLSDGEIRRRFSRASTRRRLARHRASTFTLYTASQRINTALSWEGRADPEGRRPLSVGGKRFGTLCTQGHVSAGEGGETLWRRLIEDMELLHLKGSSLFRKRRMWVTFDRHGEQKSMNSGNGNGTSAGNNVYLKARLHRLASFWLGTVRQCQIESDSSLCSLPLYILGCFPFQMNEIIDSVMKMKNALKLQSSVWRQTDLHSASRLSGRPAALHPSPLWWISQCLPELPGIPIMMPSPSELRLAAFPFKSSSYGPTRLCFKPFVAQS